MPPRILSKNTYFNCESVYILKKVFSHEVFYPSAVLFVPIITIKPDFSM